MASAFLSAAEAASALGISRATLYAYVSRGLIRSEDDNAARRTRRYRAEDVERLRLSREQRRDPQRAAAESLHFGAPIVDSSITKIDGGRLYYRGMDAVDLAATRTADEVAALIWLGDLEQSEALQREPLPSLPARFWAARDALRDLAPYDRCQALLPVAATADSRTFDVRPASVARTGRRILQVMIAAMSGDRDDDRLGRLLQQPWKRGYSTEMDLLQTALILLADHELNASTFTARCVASTGASPYSAVQAGLAALRGRKHGGASERVEALLAECGRPPERFLIREGDSVTVDDEWVRSVVVGRLQRGEGVPGFGHPLYPAGDPRAAALTGRFSYDPAIRLSRSVVAAVQGAVDERPNVDFALTMLTQELRLPPGSALCLFALGRTIGWIGHAIEEYQADRLIRPRARYVGP